MQPVHEQESLLCYMRRKNYLLVVLTLINIYCSARINGIFAVIIDYAFANNISIKQTDLQARACCRFIRVK